ncbi:uncharacterized protein TRUGW13939_02916 [Talaromyces rugulosus]|uniref:Nephrocystin 3-like N-terminal domain-containing protein n=1 Tax=Talaromyces rugulosus TaxID=121627 RepID=A0A7H8QPL8_TALRU|nr:uncharacterized protein TRUGW13939_02916 [Talaromyces rugulosus]QKX55818.1 hypothetical protein TRUGW13939_02916 [Talaromyces rugulosus]
MAEVVGLVSSIVALIELSAKIAGLSYSYARQVKNAPKTQKQYLQQVSSLIEVLYRVEQAIAVSESTGLLPVRPPSLNEDAITSTATYQKISSIHYEQDRNLLLTWVPTPSIPLRQKPSPCSGTGRWLLGTVAVQAWLSKSTELLWCYGQPGVGKSFLASVMIDHLLEKREHDSLVIYFFCDFSSRNQVTTKDILQYLLRQIVDQGSEKMLSTLKGACGDPSALQNANKVVQLLALAASVQSIYLVVDGVDELKTLNELLEHILELAKSKMRIMVTSRDLPQIRRKMSTTLRLNIKPTEHDLRLYVNMRLQDSDFVEEAAKDSSLIDDIVSKTGNIFLLTRLLLDELLDLVTIYQIRKALERPPQGLQQALEATLQRIDAQPLARRTLARRLLSWIMLAERRLKMNEVVTAFAVEDGEELHPDNMPSADILHQVCAGLVILNKDDNTVGLVHVFAYELLHNLLPKRQSHIDIAQTCLRYLSLKPLGGGPCASAAEMLNRVDSLPFLEYSSKYWGHHVISGDCEKELESLILELLDDSRLSDSAFQALQFRREYASTGTAEELFQSLPINSHALHLAAYWGLTRITGKILEAGAPPSPVDSHKWTPLHWACANNRLGVAELLLSRGADVNAQDNQGWSPLFWSAFVGSNLMVHLLLCNGADHLARSTLGWTALHWAISGGHTELAKKLLDHHLESQSPKPLFHRMTMKEIEAYANTTSPLDVVAGDQDYDIFTALTNHLQTSRGTITDAGFNEIWKRESFDVPVSFNLWRTMTKGERINGRDWQYHGTIRIENSLEKRESGPNNWKSSLLISAIRDQQLSSVELLVKAGADMENNRALFMAARRQDPRYVQCLLENGANPNATDHYGRTPLHDAIMDGFVETVGALLDGGADVNKPVTRDFDSIRVDKVDIEMVNYSIECNDIGSTALILASGFVQREHYGTERFQTQPSGFELITQITQLLLSKGADPGLKDPSGRTALHYAMLRPHLPWVKLLIDAGCPVDAVDCNGSMPLHLLAVRQEDGLDGHDLKAIVCLLLNGKCENGQADILNQPVPATSAIQDTRSSRKKNLMYFYEVEHGFESFHRTLKRAKGFEEGLTPLTMALKAGSWTLVQVLLELGATFPTHLNLTPILTHAIKSAEPSMKSLLILHGARPSPGAIYDLVNSFVAQTTPDTITNPAEGKDVMSDFKRSLEELASAGADVNFRQNEETPLVAVATKCGSETAIQALLDAGSDVYTTLSKTFDPILALVISGQSVHLDYLLDYSVAHPRKGHWSNHLNEVSHESDPVMRVCRSLQKAKVINRTNSDGRTLLHLVAQQGNIALVTALVSCGAKTDIVDSTGWLAVHCAGFAKQNSVLSYLLLEQSTKSSSKEMQKVISKDDNSTNAHNMLDVAVLDGNIDMVSSLLNFGGNSNSTIHKGGKHYTLLGYAAEQGEREIVSLLLDHGADIEKENKCGWRPVHLACYRGHARIAEILIEAGADVHVATVEWNEPHIRPQGIYQGTPWTGQPLHLAAMSGLAGIVQLLLEQGVDIHASTGVDSGSSYGPTALHLALDTSHWYGNRCGDILDSGRLQIAQWLVGRGAMVQGVIPDSLHHIRKFREFPGLWDALVAGDKNESSNISS